MIKMFYPVQFNISLIVYTWSDDVEHGIPSSALGSTRSRTTSGIKCHLCPWIENTMGKRRVWHAIIALGLQT